MSLWQVGESDSVKGAHPLKHWATTTQCTQTVRQLTICGVKLMDTFTVIWKQIAEKLLLALVSLWLNLTFSGGNKKQCIQGCVLCRWCVHVYLRLGILHPLMFCLKCEGSRFGDWPGRATFTARPQGLSRGSGITPPWYCWRAFSHNDVWRGGLKMVKNLKVSIQHSVTRICVSQTQLSVDSANTSPTMLENYISKHSLSLHLSNLSFSLCVPGYSRKGWKCDALVVHSPPLTGGDDVEQCLRVCTCHKSVRDC